VWDLHTRKRVDEIAPGGAFGLALGDTGAHLFYVGRNRKYADAIAR